VRTQKSVIYYRRTLRTTVSRTTNSDLFSDWNTLLTNKTNYSILLKDHVIASLHITTSILLYICMNKKHQVSCICVSLTKS